MIPWRWLGRLPYDVALDAQRTRRQSVIDGANEVVWCLEHEPVVTVGRRHASGLGDLGTIPIVHTERGGLATWHGPGQLVVYPLIALEHRRIGVRRYITLLEQAVIDLLRSRGVDAGRDPRGAGVWVDGAKIASIGVHIRRGVSLHGLALNLTNSLATFDRFDPCGLGAAMTRALDHGFGESPSVVASELAQRVITSVDAASGGH